MMYTRRGATVGAFVRAVTDGYGKRRTRGCDSARTQCSRSTPPGAPRDTCTIIIIYLLYRYRRRRRHQRCVANRVK